MMDRSLFLAALFSIGIHGLMASLLILPLPKSSLERAFIVEIAWEKSFFHSHSQEHTAQIKAQEGSSKLKKQSVLRLNKVTMHHKIPWYIPVVSPEPRHSETDERESVGNKRENGNGGNIKSAKTQTAHKNLRRHAYHPLPKYPWICRKRYQEGIVSIRIKTNVEGRVIHVSLHKSSGHARLDEVALEALKLWVFAEGNIQKIISISFRLKG